MDMKIVAVVGVVLATAVGTTQTRQEAQTTPAPATVQVGGQGGQAGTPVAPAAPPADRVIHIRGRDGTEETITLPSNFSARDVIPPQAVDISLAFFFTMAVIIIGLPLARAFARRMDRKTAPAQISNELSSQLTQITQAVDAIALEVERISEGQRFTTRLLSEQRDAARQTLPSAVDRG